MSVLASQRTKDGVVLIARILLVLLFLIFGWMKLTDYSGTVSYMEQTGVPLPALSAFIAILVEFFVCIGVVLGVQTRPLAALLALYTFGTALIGHRYWTMSGAARFASEINFYKISA